MPDNTNKSLLSTALRVVLAESLIAWMADPGRAATMVTSTETGLDHRGKGQRRTEVDILVQTYLIYLAICLPVILLVGWTLHRNGRVFLVEIFEGKADLADSINHLFIVGFYLAAIGFVSILLRVGGHEEFVSVRGALERTTSSPADTGEMIEVLSMKIGLVLIVLGGVHLLNLAMLAFAR